MNEPVATVRELPRTTSPGESYFYPRLVLIHVSHHGGGMNELVATVRKLPRTTSPGES